MADSTTPVMEAGVLQIVTSVHVAKSFTVVLQNEQVSKADAKGIVVEAIQLLRPDSVFSLQDEQNVTDQESGV
jgi:hypothetical protein